MRLPPCSTLFPYTTLFRSLSMPYAPDCGGVSVASGATLTVAPGVVVQFQLPASGSFCSGGFLAIYGGDGKSTRPNSSHAYTSYHAFCLKNQKPGNWS